jgi:hypothetical protein
VGGGILLKIERAFAAKEGAEFVGWNRSKQYRLTKEEINSFLLESEEPIEGGMKRFYKVFEIDFYDPYFIDINQCGILNK